MPDLKSKEIIVCSIVRDARSALRRNIPRLEAFCSAFRDYKVVVYENDSVDGTPHILNRWKERNPHVHIISEKLGIKKTIPDDKHLSCNPFFSCSRIEKMAFYRNRYLDYVRKMGWTADYLMVLDLDVVRIFPEGMFSCFRDDRTWDVVTAFGYSLSPNLKIRYHDAYALVEYGKDQEPQTEQSIREAASRLASLRGSRDWLRVYSAFGGIAVYRFPLLDGLSYQVVRNHDARVECRAEHFSLFQQMGAENLEVYINPEMQVNYQFLGIHVILGYLRRLFRRSR